MRLDWSPAELFLSYAAGDRPLDDVWTHPAYDVVRRHAALLGRDMDRTDVAGAMAGEETAFRHVEDLSENRDRIEALLEHVADDEADWTAAIEREVARVTPDESLSELTVYLGIGYEFGIGTREGAFVNLNEPLFLDHPRQLLYAAVHESSHVVYDRVHGFSDELGPTEFSPEGDQRRAFETLFHTEAYATHAPLALRRADGALGDIDHPLCADYRVLDDVDRLRDLVATYDGFRERLGDGPVEPEALLTHVFGEPRLPYRLGCAMLDRLERTKGLEAVRDGFYMEPAGFLEEHDGLLDEYRPSS